MTQSTSARERHEPERMCIVSREHKSPADMLRFVLSPDGVVVVDLKGKLPGRGVYVTARASMLRQAVKKNAFSRAFKQPVQVAPALDEQVEKLLEAQCVQALALANKAGAVVSGFAKIEAALARGLVAGIVHASDGAADGRRKLMQVARRVGLMADDAPLTSAQMAQALGKDNVIHAAILTGEAGRPFLRGVTRLRHYRAESGQTEQQENFCDADEICDKADEISAK